MMKRYFYTDPLKAAWMYREHGVAYELNGLKVIPDLIAGNNVFLLLDGVYKTDGYTYGKGDHFRYYGKTIPLTVHPDSLPIFEPQWQEDYAPGDHIIVNEKAFFMPEVENE